jgi:hypothetical protein
LVAIYAADCALSLALAGLLFARQGGSASDGPALRRLSFALLYVITVRHRGLFSMGL